MRFIDYISSKTISLCFIALEGICLFGFSVVLGAGQGFILFIEGSLLLLTLLWLFIGYLYQSSRLKKLRDTISQLDEKYLIGEVLTKPSNENELVYYEIMKTISGSAITMVEKEKAEREEYQNYVESWIHEIKTPLTAGSLILDNGGDTRKLKGELKKADNLTESILYYARTKSPEKDTVIQFFNASEVIDEAIKDQMSLLIAAGISIEKNGDFSVSSDKKTLGFILKQLLCNSAKYCRGCHITITAEKGVLSFEDDGIGIPDYEVSRITDRGFTGTNGRKLGSSTGMGLYLVKELCEHLGVRLSIQSKVDQYTRFVITFPSLTKM